MPKRNCHITNKDDVDFIINYAPLSKEASLVELFDIDDDKDTTYV